MVVREKAAVGSPDISDDFLFINKAYPGIIELKLKPNAVDVPVLISQNKFLETHCSNYVDVRSLCINVSEAFFRFLKLLSKGKTEFDKFNNPEGKAHNFNLLQKIFSAYLCALSVSAVIK